MPSFILPGPVVGSNSAPAGSRTSGRVYDLWPAYQKAGGTAPLSSALQLVPFDLPAALSISEIGIDVTTLFSGGLVMAGIYASDPTTGRPTGTPLASVTGLLTTATGYVGASATATISAGRSWVAIEADNGTCRITSLTAAGSKVSASVGLVGASSGANAFSPSTRFTFTNTYGTFPDLTGATLTESTNGGASALAIIMVKVA